MLKKLDFCDLGKGYIYGQVEDEKYIYIIPDKHYYHDLSLIVMVIYTRYKVVPVNKMMLKIRNLCDLGKSSIYGQGQN